LSERRRTRVRERERVIRGGASGWNKKAVQPAQPKPKRKPAPWGPHCYDFLESAALRDRPWVRWPNQVRASMGAASILLTQRCSRSPVSSLYVPALGAAAVCCVGEGKRWGAGAADSLNH
jgi:hypothetical protein